MSKFLFTNKKPIINDGHFKNRPIITFRLKTNFNFFGRLFFLIYAPIVWLIKGEINIK